MTPAVRAARLLAGWGLPAVEGPLGARAEALYMGQGLILQAGWADLIGRILAALDEVGVPIETNAKVIAVEDGCVHLEDGRDVEADLLWWRQDRDEGPVCWNESGSCSPGQHHRSLAGCGALR